MAATRIKVVRMKRRKSSRSDPKRSRIKLRRRQPVPPQRADIRQIRYREGYEEGYCEGVHSGIQKFPTIFEGTSIVIPTYNQLNMLKQCIDSIIANTDIPYEIIIVDNASMDGTAAYLKELRGQVRFHILEKNHGFAGAINKGMMMAKGRTILLLNNDTLVTENWLNNLLICLNSDEGIGMVGPITNYISGEQQINVPYEDIADMPKFARENNQSDPSRWRRIDRLTGFCLLFRRELFEGIGYFDEGFEIGNFEDDDYNIRVRFLGKSLVMAQDTFIHHFGSVSMKALGDRFQEVNSRNEFYFLEKWRNPYDWIHHVRKHVDLQQGPLAHSAHFYPEHVIVHAIGANYYWIEQGKRRLVEGVLTVPSVRVSQIDLRRWPLAEPINAEEVERRWRGVADENGRESGIFILSDGRIYHMEDGKARCVIGSAVMQAWNLHLKPIKALASEMLDQWVQGLPVISPPILHQVL
ncbi:glycosyltransferase family 2 protein [Cohnella sp. WQ 127256]|uniref:glycosyltransferase family 2 protein n=1 Tax=Cohnella sp. WQ 127256 TaxID=2938790 RepID=UPI002118615C|nr:glycosyltransferase family 2 protein [Cohnella sp. WQ 127256]